MDDRSIICGSARNVGIPRRVLLDRRRHRVYESRHPVWSFVWDVIRKAGLFALACIFLPIGIAIWIVIAMFILFSGAVFGFVAGYWLDSQYHLGVIATIIGVVVALLWYGLEIAVNDRTDYMDALG